MLSFAEGPVPLAFDAVVDDEGGPFVTGAAEGMIQRIQEFLNSQRLDTTRRIKRPGRQEI